MLEARENDPMTFPTVRIVEVPLLSDLFRGPKISSDELLGYLSVLRPHTPSYSHVVLYLSLWSEKQAPF